MKFGKRLRDLLEDSLPDWRNKFLSYKDLKKTLKCLPSGECSPPGGTGVVQPSSQDDSGNAGMSEELFVKQLNDELEKFNSFFMEKEEEFVIRMQVLREEIGRLKSLCPDGGLAQSSCCRHEATSLRKATVALHGEMVLLENYSALNYTGLVKILKKHDKRTGLLLRHPFISTVLRQPFLTTEILSRLVRECEQCLQMMFPSHPSAGSQVDDRSGAVGCLDVDPESNPSSPESNTRQPSDPAAEEDVEAVYRSALTALRSLQEIRGSSRTPHPFLAEMGSLPGVSFQRPKDSESNANTGRGQVTLTCAQAAHERPLDANFFVEEDRLSDHQGAALEGERENEAYLTDDESEVPCQKKQRINDAGAGWPSATAGSTSLERCHGPNGVSS